MKIVSYGARHCEQPAALRDNDTLVPLTPLLHQAGYPALDTNTLLALLPALRCEIEPLVDDAIDTIPVGATRLGPPVPHPGKVIVVGGNYPTHLSEAIGAKNVAPSEPLVVLKPSSSVIGPNDAIVRPPHVHQLDYETEIAVVTQ